MGGSWKTTRTKGPRLAGLCRMSALLLVLAVTTLAVEPAEYTGRWALDRDRSDDLEKAVDRALEPENLVTRMMARKRILKSAKVPETMEISLVGNGLLVTTETQSPPPVPLGGTSVLWPRPKGAPVKIKLDVTASQLVETFQTDHGTRVQRFSLSKDGKSLSVGVEVASPRLERKISYQVWFSRSAKL